jgi:RIO kinase 1
MSADDHDVFQEFTDAGHITGVDRTIKSGKEGTVYLCRANPATGAEFYAAKIYRARDVRTFKDDAVYKEGRSLARMDREKRAVAKKTRFGRLFDDALWIGNEAEALRRLAGTGADIPRLIASSGNALLMEYIGDASSPAPQLRSVRLDAATANVVWERLVWNIETFLANNVVHGDLSPYNVLWWEDEIRIIDFPQQVDPRKNPNAEDLLRRDLGVLATHFRRFGVDVDAEAIVDDLWMRFTFAWL